MLLGSGKTIAVDSCIASIIWALNRANMETVASCCGHGKQPGSIILRDGREILLMATSEDARKVDELFPPISPRAVCATCGGTKFVKCKHDPCAEDDCSYGFYGTFESACTPDRDIPCPSCTFKSAKLKAEIIDILSDYTTGISNPYRTADELIELAFMCITKGG